MSEYGEPIGQVTESTPSMIRVEISDAKEFEKNKRKLGIGQYLLIASGNNTHLLSTITAVRASQTDKTATPQGAPGDDADETLFRFQIDAQPIGSLSSDGEFTRGSHSLPVPTEPAFITPPENTCRHLHQSNQVAIHPRNPEHRAGHRTQGRRGQVLQQACGGCRLDRIRQIMRGGKDSPNSGRDQRQRQYPQGGAKECPCRHLRHSLRIRRRVCAACGSELHSEPAECD
jgi:hypothetical protein